MSLVDEIEEEQERIRQKNLKQIDLEIISKDKLDETFDKLTEELLTTNQMSKREYEKFIKQYLSYIVAREGIKNCALVVDHNLTENEVNGYVTEKENKLYINPRLFKNCDIKSAYKTICTLEHECQHLKDNQTHKKNIKNIDNSPKTFGFGYNKEIYQLSKLLDGRFEQQLEAIKTLNYYRDDMERAARLKESIQIDALKDNMKKVLSNNKQINKELAEKNISILNEIQTKAVKFENGIANLYKNIYENKSNMTKSLQNEITKKLQTLTLNDHISKFNCEYLIKGLNLTGIANQKNFDIIAEKFDYANLDFLDAKNLFTLANQSNYKNADMVIPNTYERVIVALQEKGASKKNILGYLAYLSNEFQNYAKKDKFSLITPEQCMESVSSIVTKYSLTLKNSTPIKTQTNDNILTKR